MDFKLLKDSAKNLLHKSKVFTYESSPLYKNTILLKNDTTSALPFFDFVTLAIFLGLTPQELSELYLKGCKDYYKTFFIDKKTHQVVPRNYPGKLREINAPSAELKEIQKRLITIFEKFPIHPANNGFVAGKNIVDAANVVKDGETLIHVDLNKFFDNHKAEFVKEKLKEKFNTVYGVELDSLTLDTIVTLLTYKGQLPQGAPSSPCLVVSLNYEMDEVVQKLADEAGLTYSRYADDLAFAGTIAYQDAKRFVKKLSKVIKPFTINLDKLKIMRTSAKSILNYIEFKKHEDGAHSETFSKSEHSKEFSKSELHRVLTATTSLFGDCEFNITEKKTYLVTGKNMDQLDRDTVEANLELLAHELEGLDGITFKPHFYYIQSTKHLLGMNIIDGKINYPRKDYENLRVIALLIGRQMLLHKFVDTLLDASAADEAIFPDRYNAEKIREKFLAILNMFSAYSPNYNKRELLSSTPVRNLLQSPLDTQHFQGILSHLHNVDPVKESKLKAIQLKSYIRCHKQLEDFIKKVDNFGVIDIFHNIGI